MLRFSICVIGIYTCFLTWGVVQERLSSTTYDGARFKHFVFLNLIQSLCACLVSYVYLKVRRVGLGRYSRPLVRKYVETAIIHAIAPICGYQSLRHIDYPTMILGKSCKLIPVMLMHWVLYRRKFQWFKYLSVAIITAGVSLFMFLHPKKDGKGAAASSLWGLSLLALNLIMDGTTNSSQDHIFQSYKVTGQQMMFSMNFMSVILHFTYLSLNPFTLEFSSAVSFIQAHPAVLQHILLFGFCGAIGQIFIFYTLENYGSVSLVTVTVTRKLGTMVLSVFWFGHRLSFGQWVAVGMVFAGIGLEEYIKKLDKLKEKVDKSQTDHLLGKGRKGSV